jgi:hypothetical protein
VRYLPKHSFHYQYLFLFNQICPTPLVGLHSQLSFIHFIPLLKNLKNSPIWNKVWWVLHGANCLCSLGFLTLYIIFSTIFSEYWSRRTRWGEHYFWKMFT